MRHTNLLHLFLLGALALGFESTGNAAEFSIARIYIEYNASGNDLGYHVSLDGEDWRSLKIVNPDRKTLFEVAGKGAYKELGMTELFFEGAEPSLADFPLKDLLALFPEGKYQFIGTTVDNERLASTATLSHAVPDGPLVSSPRPSSRGSPARSVPQTRPGYANAFQTMPDQRRNADGRCAAVARTIEPPLRGFWPHNQACSDATGPVTPSARQRSPRTSAMLLSLA